MSKNDLKLVLIGEIGIGKSQLGNFILKKDIFSVGQSTNSISEYISIIGDKRVTIVDTPGLNAASPNDFDIMEQIISKFQNDKAIDGIIFVYSFKKERRTKKDQELIQNLKKIFGDDILKTRLKVIITNCPTGEDFDYEKKKLEKQKKNTIIRLDKMISKEDIVFVNTLNSPSHKKIFYPEIENLLEQFYKVKIRLDSMNNEIIKKQELENIERQKEELEAERKKKEEEDKQRLEREKKELEEKNKSLVIQNENERNRLFVFFFLLLIVFFYFYENERKKFEKDFENLNNKYENERKKLEKDFEILNNKYENERKDKYEKRAYLKEKIFYLEIKIKDSEQKINHIKNSINNDDLAIAASSTFTVFTLGFSGFGIAHCMDSKKEHQRELKIENEKLEEYSKEKKRYELQLQEFN